MPGGTMPGSEKSEGTWIVWWEWWEYEREFYLISSYRTREGIIKPYKYVLSVLQSITLSIPMQQGKSRSHGKGAMKKGAKAKE